MFCPSALIGCLKHISSGLFTALHEWQTVWVTAITVWFAWFQWESAALIPVINKIFGGKSGPHPKLTEDDISDLAQKLSNLPKCMAKSVFKNALLKATGKATWRDDINVFQQKLDSWKRNRANLRKGKWM